MNSWIVNHNYVRNQETVFFISEIIPQRWCLKSNQIFCSHGIQWRFFYKCHFLFLYWVAFQNQGKHRTAHDLTFVPMFFRLSKCQFSEITYYWWPCERLSTAGEVSIPKFAAAQTKWAARRRRNTSSGTVAPRLHSGAAFASGHRSL